MRAEFDGPRAERHCAVLDAAVALAARGGGGGGARGGGAAVDADAETEAELAALVDDVSEHVEEIRAELATRRAGGARDALERDHFAARDQKAAQARARPAAQSSARQKRVSSSVARCVAGNGGRAAQMATPAAATPLSAAATPHGGAASLTREELVQRGRSCFEARLRSGALRSARGPPTASATATPGT